MSLFRRKKKEEKTLSEERKKEYFEFGQRVSNKLGLPEKIEKTNSFYAKHPKSMSFVIFGICCLLLLLSMISFGSGKAQRYKTVGEEPSDYTASTLFDAMEIHTSSIEKLDGLDTEVNQLKQIIDSLEKIESPTADDSVRLQKGKQLLKQLEGDSYEGH